MIEENNINFEFKKRVVIRRFAELIRLECILSAYMTLLFVSGVYSGIKNIALAALSGTIIFLLENVRQTKNCYYDLKGKIIHYWCNIIAYIIFVVINFVAFNIMSKEMYTWLFGITKILNYAFKIPNEISALVFHIVCFLIITTSPLTRNWDFQNKNL